jgi:hypothetical protein
MNIHPRRSPLVFIGGSSMSKSDIEDYRRLLEADGFDCTNIEDMELEARLNEMLAILSMLSK